METQRKITIVVGPPSVTLVFRDMREYPSFQDTLFEVGFKRDAQRKTPILECPPFGDRPV